MKTGLVLIATNQNHSLLAEGELVGASGLSITRGMDTDIYRNHTWVINTPQGYAIVCHPNKDKVRKAARRLSALGDWNQQWRHDEPGYKQGTNRRLAKRVGLDFDQAVSIVKELIADQ